MRGYPETNAPLAVKPTPAPIHTLGDAIAETDRGSTRGPADLLETITGQLRTVRNENTNTLVGSQLTYILENLYLYRDLMSAELNKAA